MRKLVVLKIDSCLDCPHFDGRVCVREDRKVSRDLIDLGSIPEWCDLEDIE